MQHDAAGAALDLGATLAAFSCRHSPRSTTLLAAQVTAIRWAAQSYIHRFLLTQTIFIVIKLATSVHNNYTGEVVYLHQGTMQVFYSYLICPECDLHNTPWRTFCKSCRGPLYTATKRPLSHTDITIKLYRGHNEQATLLISPQYIAYQTLGLSIQSAWENIKSLPSGFIGPHLLLKEPAVLSIDSHRFERNPQIGHQIPLRPFGYPQSNDLIIDLRQFTPKRLRKYLRLL